MQSFIITGYEEGFTDEEVVTTDELIHVVGDFSEPVEGEEGGDTDCHEEEQGARKGAPGGLVHTANEQAVLKVRENQIAQCADLKIGEACLLVL